MRCIALLYLAHSSVLPRHLSLHTVPPSSLLLTAHCTPGIVDPNETPFHLAERFVKNPPSKAKPAKKNVNSNKDISTVLTGMFSCLSTTAVKHQPKRFTAQTTTQDKTNSMANPMARERAPPTPTAGQKIM
jgi:hypothetical protein